MNIELIRNQQYIAMENNLKTAASLLSLFPAADLITYRDGGTGWTVTEVFCHLRDFELLFLERATLTVTQDMPDLPFPKPDDWAAERHYKQVSAADALAGWQANRAKFLTFLKERSETDWARTAKHPTRGILSLLDQLVITPQHDTIHFEQFTRILAEKKA